VVVGVNRFQVDAPSHQARISTASLKTETEQIHRLAEIKRNRNDEAVKAGLDHLDSVSREGSNTIPAIIESVRAYATVGEICTVLANNWGRFNEHHR
jgi:methylmalonyl-CoA mutase N-terminal domain/subunit